MFYLSEIKETMSRKPSTNDVRENTLVGVTSGKIRNGAVNMNSWTKLAIVLPAVLALALSAMPTPGSAAENSSKSSKKPLYKTYVWNAGAKAHSGGKSRSATVAKQRRIASTLGRKSGSYRCTASGSGSTSRCVIR